MRVNKNLIIVIIPVLFSALACNNNQQEGQNNIGELKAKEKEGAIGKSDEIKFKNYIRPIVIDTFVFYYEGEGDEVKHYHINAYSKIDTANIEFYINWYDSIVDEFKGGKRSFVLFFNDSIATPKIALPTIVPKEFEEYGFLFIKHERGALEYHWTSNK
jgi:hypothetical protein